MKLSKGALHCIRKLEQAGYAAYAVGGCVRDSLLGLSPHDYDLCTNACPEEIARVFADNTLVRSGEKHGTIGVVLEQEVFEITTFRREGGYEDSRHPDWVRFVGSVEEDLSRRDFTVNAMAYSPQTGYIDPWGGRQDLQEKRLRCVGDPETRFREDPLRILRGVRFAVRFHLTPEAGTKAAMLALAPEMEHLARERVFDELCKLLPLATAQQLLEYREILTQVLPELKPTVGFLQHSPYHAYDVYTHTACVVEAVPGELPLRLAALLHDAGKPGVFYRDEGGRGHFPDHAKLGAEMADKALLRLRAPTALRKQVTELIRLHMTELPPDKRILRRRLAKYGEPTVSMLLKLQQADRTSKGVLSGETDLFPAVKAMLAELLQEDNCLSLRDLNVNGRDLMALGLEGSRIGFWLDRLFRQVLEEELPNDREVLLRWLQSQLEM